MLRICLLIPLESGSNRSYRVPGTRFIELIVGLQICQVFFAELENMCEKIHLKKCGERLKWGQKKKRQCHLLKKSFQRSDHKPNLVFLCPA